MKKVLIFIIAISVLNLSNNSIFAQEYKSTVGIDAGVSIVGVAIRAVAYSEGKTASDYKYSSTPVLQLTYGYMLTKNISVGVAGSHQEYKFSIPDGSVAAEIKRSNFAIRGLFHYGSSDRIDMYSGVRLGYTIWGTDVKTTDPTLKPTLKTLEKNYLGKRFAAQLVAFGIRGYFTKNIGAHAEFSIGSPYYLVAGLNFRF